MSGVGEQGRYLVYIANHFHPISPAQQLYSPNHFQMQYNHLTSSNISTSTLNMLVTRPFYISITLRNCFKICKAIVIDSCLHISFIPRHKRCLFHLYSFSRYVETFIILLFGIMLYDVVCLIWTETFQILIS